jgi:hypothetical protein
MVLDYCDKEVLKIAVKQGVVGLADVRSCCRCGNDRARFVLQRLTRQSFLTQKWVGGGFAPTDKCVRRVQLDSL